MKRAIYANILHPILSSVMRRTSSDIPKYDLDNQHVENARLLKSRQALLQKLAKNAVVAELGVNKGDFSDMIPRTTSPKKFHLIDFWGSTRYNQNIRKSVENRFSDQLADNSMEINLGLSTEVVTEFEDGYFDWIYIDTAHTYKVTKEELELYRPKMKKNGIIAGHDYILGNWEGAVRYGVVESVHEFCLEHG